MRRANSFDDATNTAKPSAKNSSRVWHTWQTLDGGLSAWKTGTPRWRNACIKSRSSCSWPTGPRHQACPFMLMYHVLSLLVEFAVTGEPISNESLNDLSAYVNVITSTITLQDDALFHDSLKAAARHKIVPTDSSRTRTSSSSPASIPPPVLTSSPAPSMVVPPSPANRYDSDMADMDDDDDDDVPAPDDEDRLNPFNVMLDTCKQPRTEPMAIPMNDTRSSDGSSSGGRSLSQSSSSFPSDYCHLEREYGDELSEMTSFSSTAPRKEWQPPPPSKKKHAAAGKRPHHPYENAVYDLTVSYDFQKERMSNPFVAKAVTVVSLGHGTRR
ncbi:hypothetical protein, variant 3 [Aphanomyces astaci]|uniref:Uncharacterized protein n=1 Tax=Aphanomyces astaci TaxID=112090 RepID=W4G6N1_APHAT|nr:hypothetical protein, variant 3 [Aphanomyces astaci]ETV74568.1 hypothetical protein, variant 3 [Aphanomyces astaci]|eukprot:XP_009835655.1 hypothetical protein, variant 3 [Aphanomyces astaci]